jgi:membrane peptidoglycan carboxypeptidase
MTPAVRIAAQRRLDRVRRRPAPGRMRRQIGALLGVVLAVVVATSALAAVLAISTVSVLSTDLPDPNALAAISFNEPTIVYDRSGRVELGRFQRERRRVVDYPHVPRLVLDATTTAEDRSFWSNAGVDVPAIISAAAGNAAGANERGASTITQQLVRARLLPDGAVAAGADRYLRKVKEILQALRLNDTYPGEAGKERVITAYLNEIFYGHDAYGIAAAANTYFGITDLSKLTIAQAALLAGLPKSPTILDPYRFAKRDAKGRLVVRPDSPPVVRRDWILHGLRNGARWTTLTDQELTAALAEPVVLAGVPPARIPGGQFTWQVRRQLREILGPSADIETGGYRVITTLDWRAQTIAQKYLAAAAISPNLSNAAQLRLLRQLKVRASERSWIRALRGKDLHNGALVALDYRTGDVLAYVGSAGYARDSLASRKFEPKYDAAGDGARQPGSAFKAILYASAFDNRRLTPGSLLLDVTTEFDHGQRWAPRDADQLERGPVLVRRAIQYSLNIPAIRALQRTGSERVADTAEALGLRFAGGRQRFIQAGLAGALGTVEVRPLDLTAAYGTIANGGVRVPPRMVLEIRGPDGRVVWKAPRPAGTRAISAGAAYLVTDILAGNTIPSQNPIWSAKLELRNTKNGSHRPAAVKTGTANDARDLATYGFLAPPASGGRPAIAVGVWMGNSDHSNPRARKPAISLTAAAPLWRAFVREYTQNWPISTFRRPKGVVKASIDKWSGGKPGPWTRQRISEWFIAGTQPGARREVDQAGLLYSVGCGGWRVDPVKAELGLRSWDDDVASWVARARAGPGVGGRFDSRTAYFWGESSWGGPLVGSCARPRPHDTKPGKAGGGQGGKDHGHGHGDHGGTQPTPTPPPAPTPAPAP